MSQRHSTIRTDQASSVVITRKAINTSGRIGSLYDGYRDQIIGRRIINVQGQRFKTSKLTQCEFIKGSMDISRNILRFIGTEDDLRISLLLHTTQPIGIAGILTYPKRINDYTRLLYYSWVDREEQISDDVIRNQKLNEPLRPTTPATHLITGISYGIDVIVILQIPPETRSIPEIDRILHKIYSSLSRSAVTGSLLTSEDIDLTKNIKITVYSNIPILTGSNKVSNLLHLMDTIKKDPNQCQPINYILRSLALLHPQYTGKGNTIRTLPPELNNRLERYMLREKAIVTNLNISLHDDILKFLSGNLEGRFHGIHKQYSRIEENYLNEIKRLSKLIIDFRSGQIDISLIRDELIDKEQTILKNDGNELIQNLNDLKDKAYLISDLRKYNFIYYNAVEHGIDQHDNEETIKTKLITNDEPVRIHCSDDALNKNNHKMLNKLLSDLVDEREKNPNLRLIYADFTYCKYKLHNMLLFSSDNLRNNRNIPKQKLPSPPINSQSSIRSHIPVQNSESRTIKPDNFRRLPPNDEFINILLLGETGVGKSTFINAFANYLTFNSLQQAQSNKPAVIIPVSFLITVGDHFEECTLKFGDVDNSYNEDFNHSGESVTQHCKSYIFHLNRINGKKIRIIDTPGFGDTRGLEQDDRNMQHILEYINNLTHLNAICFLLKPNTSKLNIFFRSCFNQLFTLLDPNAGENIIFCFTNARSTFFTPGNTGPLLKTMLASLSMSDIQFQKENTFCFDSESFRFLVALRNNVLFNSEDKNEYEKSWSASVKESNRLIDYITTKLPVYVIENGRQSIKNAQFEISHMIRPMLETIRNILRNLILYRMNSSKVLIELHPKIASHPIAICLSCTRRPVQVDRFWITPDYAHHFQNKCRTCTCATILHYPIDYMLEYRTTNRPSNYPINEMNDMLRRLYLASAEFSHFLIHGARCTKYDLFILGILRMIREENDICVEKGSNQMNSQLIEELEKVRHAYHQRMHEVDANQNRKTLPNIYEQIKIVCSYSQIREQMNAVRQGQKVLMEQNEVVV